MLDGCVDVPVVPRDDAESAADLYLICRSAGETVRRVNDCLIAAVAIRASLPVLHRDRDFEAIARHSALQLVSL
jgi:predicted nucleic acid-binding protein